ncbi:MAG TPA: hypothetical protein VH912_23195 [Streptosporangiaceae bacterium]|jgi:enoyl-CoA hydratase/carnithine racemase
MSEAGGGNAVIDVDVTDGIGVVRLTRGKVNALDLELCRAIVDAMRGMDAEHVRATMVSLWKTAAADGRIQVFMDQRLHARQGP